MAANGMKMEDDFSNIKMDPEGASPSLADIDEYEDTGELVMPRKVTTWNHTNEPEIPTGWLLRIPKELWAGLADLPMDEEIHIGNVKVWDQGNNKPQKTRLEMTTSAPGWDQIPKQYDMTATEATLKKDKDPTLKNTFVFSEKNLPGFRRNNGARGQGVDSKTGGPVKVEKPRQRGPRTIPKHTEMLGLVNAEFTCSPRDNEEYRRIRAAKEEALKSKHKKLNLLQGEAATALIRTGMTDATTFSTTAPEKKKRPQENKATRMDESSLIDALTELFRQYRFWPIASIKSRLKQPEAYLREVLGRIGTLVKTGQAANTWTLNDTYLASLELSDDLKSQGFKEEGAGSVKAEEVAPIKVEDADGDMSMDDDDDDDDDDEDDFVQA